MQHCQRLKKLWLIKLTTPSPVEVAVPSLEGLVTTGSNVSKAVLFAVAANCSQLKRYALFYGGKHFVTDASHAAVQAIVPVVPTGIKSNPK